MTTTPAIAARGLGKDFGPVRALDALDLDVTAGAFFALLGPNGAGKTTAIHLFATLVHPSRGSAVVVGHDIVREGLAVRREIGLVFQEPTLDRDLTVVENLRFAARLWNLPGRLAESRAFDLLERFGLVAQRDTPVRALSGGQRRSADIVRGLLAEPRLLFLDEPTAGLDVPSRRALWDYLTTIRRDSGTTIFLTTHYLEEAEEADHICIIDDGKIVSFGTPNDIKRDLVQEYVLVDADDRRRLRDELARLELPSEGDGPFKILLDGRGVHPVLKSIDTPLSVVRTHTPTLEDAYLEIVTPKGE